MVQLDEVLNRQTRTLPCETSTVISEEIRARYAQDPRIPHPAEVAVSELNGTVTLRGSVGSFPQRHAAAKIAESVRGVRAVVNELSVDPRDHWDDDELKGAALQRSCRATTWPRTRSTSASGPAG